ncbi:MAG: alpha-glucuronidase family glycosyl hydrolase [Fusicatenibacter sp.]|nr:alpha-glucuronidase [Fusicatenibacter sp.]
MSYENAWLAYQKKPPTADAAYFSSLYVEGDHRVIATAREELLRAAREMFGKDMILCENREEATISFIWDRMAKTGEEGYHVREDNGKITITSEGPKGILYGCFACIRWVKMEKPFAGMDLLEKPSNPIRILNHWDNMDGSIERGYSGKSFFFRDEKVLVNERTRAYARMIASVGINASVINNVNVKGNATRLIDPVYQEELVQMAEIFADYGIRLYFSLNFAAPMELGGLSTADPQDEQVQSWWQEKMKDVFRRIPNLGGFLVKADSEGRPGPFTYGRTHADGANMLARAVEPYGGIIIWRCFVYNCQQDWRDKKTDRARSGYDNFMPLDGTFLDNVILQIKNGPMDFQVREPVSPLLGGLTKTNQMLEVQIAQEYTGQQRHVCYLIPMFREVLEHRTYCSNEQDTVADIISGRTFHQTNCGMAAVANTGDDENWTGHDLAAANLYGFGRLSFDTDLSSEAIAKEWIACTFGTDPEVMEKIEAILMMSWPAYEKYTSPLGIGWMVNPGFHYGPNVDGYEYDRWGTYHRADHLGIGVDRTSHGTGYAQQYREPLSSQYESLEKCPEELLLFFHHVSYTYRLKTGKTLIQHIYDTHFEGAEDVEKMAELWDSLEGKIPEKSFERVQNRFAHQMDHSKEWRDQINSYFYRKSFLEDEKHRTIY